MTKIDIAVTDPAIIQAVTDYRHAVATVAGLKARQDALKGVIVSAIPTVPVGDAATLLVGATPRLTVSHVKGRVSVPYDAAVAAFGADAVAQLATTGEPYYRLLPRK